MMKDARRKMPDDNQLRRDAASGKGLAQIATRYCVSRDHLRRRLKELGLVVPQSAMPAEERADLAKIIVERRVSATEYGGTVIQRISLPRISMYVAALEGRP